VSSVVFYFQVHQPYRVRRYRQADVGRAHDYFDDGLNSFVVKRVAERCYVPMNRLLKQLIDTTDGRFRCAFSISGTALDQMQAWAPEALQTFIELAETGCVEFLCETSHHSLAFDGDMEEFRAQVASHRARIERLFGTAPTTFRNTELVIDEKVAKVVEELGFTALLGEGADKLLNGKSSCFLYRPRGCSKLKLMLRHYPLSDDVGFRFSNKKWPGYPLYADNFAKWLHEAAKDVQFIGLYMDYETFGEHQWAETGILEFMRHVPREVLAKPGVAFATPSEIATACEPVAELPIPRPFSWADQERDLTAWLGNPMQRDAHRRLYQLAANAKLAAERGKPELLAEWRRLTTSDHVYYMCTKFASDGDVHEYFSPYDSPHDAYLNFVCCLDDLEQRLVRAVATKPQPKKAKKRGTLERPVLPVRDQLGGLQQDRRDLHRHLEQGQDDS
jgi:alpha-amylase